MIKFNEKASFCGSRWISLLCWYKGSENFSNLCSGRGKTSRQATTNYFYKFLISCSNLNTCMYLWSPRRRGWSQRAPPPPQCAFTLLIPEGPRVWHSRHSDLSPSSVTYYRRLVSPQSFHSNRGSRQPVRVTREMRLIWLGLDKKKKKRGSTSKVVTNEVDNRDCLWWERELVRRSSVFSLLAQKKKATKEAHSCRPTGTFHGALRFDGIRGRLFDFF